jgi:hypothetical protein
MSEAEQAPADEVEALRARAEALEREVDSLRREGEARLIRAELRNEALRAGMVDLDGLKLLEPASLSVSTEGVVLGAAELMTALRRDKPWLFGQASSSSPAFAPRSQPTRPRLATEMSLDEWRSARAELLRRR